MGKLMGEVDAMVEDRIIRERLKAPFPWFGGKSRVADLVWQRFGDVPNYIEPFAGSLAVLLARPHDPHTETINDLDCMVANFWRALSADPDAVAQYADWPPYMDSRTEGLYAADSLSVAAEVRHWAIENGNNRLLRIALCGYEGEHDLPGWDCVEWKAKGGYGSQGKGTGRENAGRERIWFSPHCLAVKRQQEVFDFTSGCEAGR
jgi:hypothetical protein